MSAMLYFPEIPPFNPQTMSDKSVEALRSSWVPWTHLTPHLFNFPLPPKQCWICYLQDLLCSCTILKTGRGGGSQSTQELKWNNGNIEIGTHFSQLSQLLLSLIAVSMEFHGTSRVFSAFHGVSMKFHGVFIECVWSSIRVPWSFY